MSAPPSQGMNNLATLIKRLEAATSRLEDIASSADPLPAGQNGSRDGSVGGYATGENGTPRPSTVGQDSQGGGAAAASGSPAQELPKSIQEMDELINNEGRTYLEASKGLDSLIEGQAASLANAFSEQRRFLLVSTRAKKPDMSSPAFSEMIKTLQLEMSNVSDVRDNNRASPMKEHLAMAAEAITSLQWLVMEGKPADFIGDVIGGAQMYGNRVLKAYKESDQKHVKYVQACYALLKALQAYIKKVYPTGVTWNNNGIDTAQAWRESEGSGAVPQSNGALAPPPAPPAGGAGGPPPPPPPPPLPTFEETPADQQSSKKGGQDTMGAVFEQLNRGESVTAGLKKVDKSQMTHKNPSLRSSSSVPDSETARSRSRGPETKPKPASMRQNSTASTASQKKSPPARKELDGNKWYIENFDSPASPIEVEVEIQHSILISKCKNTTIILKGKANAVSIDNSSRTQILVDTLVSSVDVIKCPNFALQVTGALPTVMLDQVDGATLYLGKESLATEVFTSKCSSVNVVLPPVKEEDDSVECPLPEQIRTYIKDGKLVSEIVEHAG
ncbi:hypothetical protein K431DRAFT_283181 [Polychaeton citri CBS 116435]|uniref:Adenylyl cyclase-associated protein n=1 Tax=Polychaeton citri CBS 116435 TaxID=1314669 RepID=A0A9P4QEC9_9PEZI|nr:hypothetical protein K431DRAFT_283181 [Polychaeton citri CBS 116435]